MRRRLYLPVLTYIMLAAAAEGAVSVCVCLGVSVCLGVYVCVSDAYSNPSSAQQQSARPRPVGPAGT